MNIVAGQTTYVSSFEEDGWRLDDGKEVIVIPYEKIYNYHPYKIHVKTDMFTLGLFAMGAIVVSPWVLACIAIPVGFYAYYADKIRLDTQSGDIIVKFMSIEDKNEFLASCKKKISKQRMRAFRQGWVGESKNTLLDKLIDKVTQK